MKEAYKQKQIIIDEIKDKFERAESAVVIDYMGITVAEADEMRKSFVKQRWITLGLQEHSCKESYRRH